MQVEEECGFKVSAESLQLVTGYRSSVGTSGSHHTLFYAEVGVLARPLASSNQESHSVATASSLRQRRGIGTPGVFPQEDSDGSDATSACTYTL